MRHSLRLTLSITPLARSMTEAAASALLVTPTATAQRLPTRRLRTAIRAVAITAITTRADHHPTVATGTTVLTTHDRHRHTLPMKAGPQHPEAGYFHTWTVLIHGLRGVRYRNDS